MILEKFIEPRVKISTSPIYASPLGFQTAASLVLSGRAIVERKSAAPMGIGVFVHLAAQRTLAATAAYKPAPPEACGALARQRTRRKLS